MFSQCVATVGEDTHCVNDLLLESGDAPDTARVADKNVTGSNAARVLTPSKLHQRIPCGSVPLPPLTIGLWLPKGGFSPQTLILRAAPARELIRFERGIKRL